MPPFLGGGEMILDVRKDGFLPNHIPHKFEAGTPPIAEIVGLGAAVRYLDGLGMDRVREHEVSLTAYALRHPPRPLRPRSSRCTDRRSRPAGAGSCR